MRTVDTDDTILRGSRVFWLELFMIFCHVFWLTEFNGQSFNDDAQWILKKNMANININVNHFKKIHADLLPAFLNDEICQIRHLFIFLTKI
jgi:hypothetical protein